MESDMSEENTRSRLMRSAVTHYTEKLRKLLDDPELNSDSIHYLKKDLLDEKEFAEKVKLRLQKEGYEWESEIGRKPALEFEDERKVIVSALQSYLNDLQQSKKMLIEKLGTTPNLEKLHHELNYCSKYLEDINTQFPKKT
jgi:hypothetical protein